MGKSKASGGSRTVFQPPDFSIVRVLRGYVNFEDVYQGQSTDNLIYLSDRQSGKDPDAEIAFNQLQAQWRANGNSFGSGLTDNGTGISPWLQRGIPVTMGSWLILYLPYVTASAGGAPMEYYIGWRNRSNETYRRWRAPFHVAYDGQGQTDDGSTKSAQAAGIAPPGPAIFAGAATARFLITGFWESALYPPAAGEPATGPAVFDAVQQVIKVDPQGAISNFTPTPLFPYINPAAANPVGGDVMQGYLKNAVAGSNQLVYVTHTIRCKGDELILAVKPAPNVAGTYNFDSTTYTMSLLFGRAGYVTGNAALATIGQNPQLGVYITTGTTP